MEIHKGIKKYEIPAQIHIDEAGNTVISMKGCFEIMHRMVYEDRQKHPIKYVFLYYYTKGLGIVEAIEYTEAWIMEYQPELHEEFLSLKASNAFSSYVEELHTPVCNGKYKFIETIKNEFLNNH